MEELEEIRKEINLIKERNKKVEADKAWETSGSRVLSILVMTYALTSIVFYFIGVKNFMLSAFIPTIGFYLSTRSLPVVKRWWLNKYNKK